MSLQSQFPTLVLGAGGLPGPQARPGLPFLPPSRQELRVGRGKAGLRSKATSCSALFPRTSGCSLGTNVEGASGGLEARPRVTSAPSSLDPSNRVGEC